MWDVINIVLPLFTVIGCGYFAAYSGLLSKGAVHGVNILVLYFALPALLFSMLAQSNVFEQLTLNFIWGYLFAFVGLFWLTFWLGRKWFKYRTSESSLFAMSGVYGNTGYMAVPLVSLFFSPEATIPIILILFLDLLIIIPLVGMLINLEKSAHSSIIQIITRACWDVINTPIVWAIIAGLFTSAFGLSIPKVADNFLNLIAAAAAPGALFAIGAALFDKPIEGDISPTIIISLIKLIVLPWVVYVAYSHVFIIPTVWIIPAVVGAAVPVAVTVYIVANQHATYIAPTSTNILVSTGLSILSLTALFLVV